MKRYLAPIFSILFLLLYLVSNYRNQTPKSDFDFDLLGSTPVLLNGRIQPMDSVARNSLLAINGKRNAKYEDGTRHRAIEWLAELMLDGRKAETRPVFRIYDDGLRSILPTKQQKEDDEDERSPIAALLLGKGSSQFYYSFAEIMPLYERLRMDAIAASEFDAKERNRYQTAVIELVNGLGVFHALRNSVHHGELDSFREELEILQTTLPAGIEALNKQQAGETFDEEALAKMISFARIYQNFEKQGHFFTHPTLQADGELDWKKAGALLGEISADGTPSPTTLAYASIVDAYRQGDTEKFNASVAELHQALRDVSPQTFGKSAAERTFNYLEPFYIAMVGYVMVLLLAIVSWIRWPEALSRAAFATAALSLLIHTAGIGYRIYIIGYAPVINLYSSAIFVGWGAVVLALILERLHRNGIGNVVASLVGFSTLLVAHHLGDDGDTLEMMRAVLDSNFWLSTHVITITIGYSATFLAGAIALVFVLMGLFTARITPDMEKSVKGMVYGIICFSMLFSFVGTVLGGIWADQSWGRFWGWDPKENGAILIVLWNAVILHSRWGGFIKTRGLMAMAIFGNIVTSWSWMGTNMLGIGLHSYGFMSAAFYYLVGFVASQLVFIGLAMLPTQMWKSNIKA